MAAKPRQAAAAPPVDFSSITQGIARKIEDDKTLSSLVDELSADEFEDLLTELAILSEVKSDLLNGDALERFVAAARKDRMRVDIAQLRKRLILGELRLDAENDFSGAMLLAEHELRQAIARQALGKFLDDRKFARKGKASRDPISAFNGGATKLVAARLPAPLRNQFAQISNLLALAGITVSRQSVRQILREAKQ